MPNFEKDNGAAAQKNGGKNGGPKPVARIPDFVMMIPVSRQYHERMLGAVSSIIDSGLNSRCGSSLRVALAS